MTSQQRRDPNGAKVNQLWPVDAAGRTRLCWLWCVSLSPVQARVEQVLEASGSDGGFSVTLVGRRALHMKSLFDTAVANQVRTRLGNLEAQSERRWGNMTAAQMLAHCSLGMQWAVGEVVPEKAALPLRVMGLLVKPLVFRNEDPLRKNTSTVKSLIVTGDRDFTIERDRLSELVDRFAKGGEAGCTKNPHSFFGKITPEEWAILMYKHLDHHLRQFGV